MFILSVFNFLVVIYTMHAIWYCQHPLNNLTIKLMLPDSMENVHCFHVEMFYSYIVSVFNVIRFSLKFILQSTIQFYNSSEYVIQYSVYMIMFTSNVRYKTRTLRVLVYLCVNHSFCLIVCVCKTNSVIKSMY